MRKHGHLLFSIRDMDTFNWPQTFGLTRRTGHRVVVSAWLGQFCQGSGHSFSHSDPGANLVGRVNLAPHTLHPILTGGALSPH